MIYQAHNRREVLTFLDCPPDHWKQVRTTNAIYYP